MLKVPHNRLTFSEKEVAAVVAVLRSGYWAGGPHLRQMERELCNRFMVSDATGVGSGLAALRLALLSLGIGAGDLVIVPAYSCVAIANAVLSLGAVPQPVDVTEGTWNLDPSKAEMALVAETRAIIAVNTFGAPADINGLKTLGLPVIEDCSHGFRVNPDGSVAAFESDLAVFSFYATKLIASGEGGAVLDVEKSRGDFVRDWRDYTDKAPDGARLNDKMTDIEASLVLEQLNRMQEMLMARRRLAERYLQVLANVDGVVMPRLDPARIWYRFVINLPAKRMRQVEGKLNENGIAACSPVEWWLKAEDDRFQVAKEAWRTGLSIPIYPSLSESEQDAVCAQLKLALAS